MAQDIIITPRSGEPSIAFTGSGITASSINLKVLSDSTLSFEGTQGQLFSITDNLTSGVIFGVNDIGGLPLIEASANGNVSLVRYGNNVGIGTGSPAAKLDILETWNTSAVQTGIKLNVIDASSNANSLLADFQVSNSSIVSITKGGLITTRRASQGFRLLGLSDGSSKFYSIDNNFVYNSRIQANGTDIIAFDSSRVAINGALQLGYIDANQGTRISLFGTNTTFQIRGIANPSLQIYNTYTDASNYERAGLNWNASAFEIETEASGTGLARNLIIGTSGVPRIFVSSTGQIGIGTQTPTVDLHLSGGTPTINLVNAFNDTLQIRNNGGSRNGSIGLGTSKHVYGNAWMQAFVDTTMDFYTNGSTGAMRLQNGKLFIGGLIEGSQRLHVSGNAIITSSLTLNNPPAMTGGITNALTIYRNGSGGDGAAIEFRRDGDQSVGRIYHYGQAIVGQISIDPYVNYAPIQPTQAPFVFRSAGATSSVSSNFFADFGLVNGTAKATINIFNSSFSTETIGLVLNNPQSSNRSDIAIKWDNWIGQERARIVGEAIGNSTSAGALSFYTTNNTTGPAQRMIIDSSGQIGIGITNPSYRLHVAASSYPVAYVSGLTTDASSQYTFETNGRLRIGATDGTFGEKIRFNNGYGIETFGGGGIRIRGGAYTSIADATPFDGAYFSPGYFGEPSLELRSKFETQTLLELWQQSFSTQTDDYFRIVKSSGSGPQRIFTITSSGWVGVGVSNPSGVLTVQDVASSGLNPLLDLRQTWNTTSAVTAIKLNVTDTASNSASLLMDLQVTGSSKFSVNKSGQVVLPTGGTIKAPQADIILGSTNSGAAGFGLQGNEVVLTHGGSNGYVRLNRSGFVVNLRVEDQNDVLSQFRGTNPQTFRIYNTYTAASSFERASFEWNANSFTIKTEASGTGLVRNLILAVSSSPKIILSGTGEIEIGTSSTDKIGFWNADPIVQPTTSVSGATFVENAGGTAVNTSSTFGGYTLAQIAQALKNMGLLA